MNHKATTLSMGDTNGAGSQNLSGKTQNHLDRADAVSVAASSETDEESPEDGIRITRSVTTTATPYRPFPRVMKAFYQWNLSGWKVFYLCGPGGEHERLFAVEQHTGLSFSGPLGIRPGMIVIQWNFDQGPHSCDICKSGISVALVGPPFLWSEYTNGETLAGCRPYAFNPNSIILLPPRTPGSKFMVREMMRARSIDNVVSFRFSLDVGLEEKTRRETFEWRKIKKAEKNEEAKQGGFKLVRVQLGASTENSNQAVPSSSSSSTATADRDNEVLALFAWTKTISSPKNPFTLELKVDGVASGLGESWTLAVVATAMRLWMLHMYGKTNLPVVAISDKMRK